MIGLFLFLFINICCNYHTCLKESPVRFDLVYACTIFLKLGIVNV